MLKYIRQSLDETELGNRGDFVCKKSIDCRRTEIAHDLPMIPAHVPRTTMLEQCNDVCVLAMSLLPNTVTIS